MKGGKIKPKMQKQEKWLNFLTEKRKKGNKNHPNFIKFRNWDESSIIYNIRSLHKSNHPLVGWVPVRFPVQF